MEQKKYDIFISYSRRDSEIVLPIVRDLESQGYVVWIDTKGIECSEQFKTKIVRIISNSTVFMFFSSEHSNSSEWTAKEIGIAVARKKPIIPIKLDNTLYNESVEFDLINLDFADYTTDPQKAKEKIQKAVVTHCGVSENQKEQEEHQRQLRLKQAQLQVKYDILREQFSELGKKKEVLLRDMQKYGIDISTISSVDKSDDISEEIASLSEEKQALQNHCDYLQTKIAELQTKIKELEDYISEHEMTLTHKAIIQKQSTWQKIKEGFKVRPTITSVIITLSFIISLSCLVYLYFHTISKIEYASIYYFYTRSLAIREFPIIIITLITAYGLWYLLQMEKKGSVFLAIAFILLNVYFPTKTIVYDVANGCVSCINVPTIIWSTILIWFFISFLFLKRKGVPIWRMLDIHKTINDLHRAINSNPTFTNILLCTSFILSFISLIVCAIFIKLHFIMYLYPILLFYILIGIYLMILKKKLGVTIIHTISILALCSLFVWNEPYPHVIFTIIVYTLILLSLIPRYNGKRFYQIININDSCCNSGQSHVRKVLNFCIILWVILCATCYKICEDEFYSVLGKHIEETTTNEPSTSNIAVRLQNADNQLDFFEYHSQWRRKDVIQEIESKLKPHNEPSDSVAVE